MSQNKVLILVVVIARIIASSEDVSASKSALEQYEIRNLAERCRCAGVQNVNSEGNEDCNSLWYSIAYCYVEPGVCSDGLQSSLMPTHEWSFNACDNDCVPTLDHVVTNPCWCSKTFCEANHYCFEDETTNDLYCNTNGFDSCPCLGIDNLPQDIKDEISCIGNNCSSNFDFPEQYGDSCLPWEAMGTWFENCHQDSPPDHCQKKWCYVDPTSCAADNEVSSWFTLDRGFTSTVSFSYGTCGDVDVWKVDKAATEFDTWNSTYLKLASGQVCHSDAKITSDIDCQIAAIALGFTWIKSWSKDNQFPACLANRQNQVYFNDSPLPATSKFNPSFSGICQHFNHSTAESCSTNDVQPISSACFCGDDGCPKGSFCLTGNECSSLSAGPCPIDDDISLMSTCFCGFDICIKDYFCLDGNVCVGSKPPTTSPTTPDPTKFPTLKPTNNPTEEPTEFPSKFPTTVPTSNPTHSPTQNPTSCPSKSPTGSPSTTSPSKNPTTSPTNNPTKFPTNNPTEFPSKFPTNNPTRSPSKSPTTSPTDNPSQDPTKFPSKFPTSHPTSNPTNNPTEFPSKYPTRNPTSNPTTNPTENPTQQPSSHPTQTPTNFPSKSPTSTPTKFPTIKPTTNPTEEPTQCPTNNPTNNPTNSPTQFPSKFPTGNPTQEPTRFPSKFPTTSPTQEPTRFPSKFPTTSPTQEPTRFPSKFPTTAPTINPTKEPSRFPSQFPTTSPTQEPTNFPSKFPTTAPTINPTQEPSSFPSKFPTTAPTQEPTSFPSKFPTTAPTINPTKNPTKFPSKFPTTSPTQEPSSFPSKFPTTAPTIHPIQEPTNFPSKFPTTAPTIHPSQKPTKYPSKFPTISPTNKPTQHPTKFPSKSPTTTNATNVPTKLPTTSPTINNQEPTRSPSKFPTKDWYSIVLPDKCHGIRKSTCGMGLMYVALMNTQTVNPELNYKCPDGSYWATVEQYNKIRGISKTCSKSTYVYKGECGWEHFVFNEVTRSDFIFNDGLGFMNDQYVLAAGSMETYSVINVGSTNSLKVDFENPSSGYKLAGMICIDAHACVVSNTVQTGKVCECSGMENTCTDVEYCYGGVCNTNPADSLEVVKKKEINFDNAVSNTIENDRNVDKFNKPAAHDTIQKSESMPAYVRIIIGLLILFLIVVIAGVCYSFCCILNNSKQIADNDTASYEINITVPNARDRDLNDDSWYLHPLNNPANTKLYSKSLYPDNFNINIKKPQDLNFDPELNQRQRNFINNISNDKEGLNNVLEEVIEMIKENDNDVNDSFEPKSLQLDKGSDNSITVRARSPDTEKSQMFYV